MKILNRLIVAAGLLLMMPQAHAYAGTTSVSTPPGAIPTQADLAGCIYEATPTAATDGTARGLHCDANGKLLMSNPGGTVSNPATIKPSFEQTVSGSATALATQTGYVNGVVIKALTTNTGTVCVGDSTVNLTTLCYPLRPGEAISYGVTTTAAIYVIDSTITDVVGVTGN